MVNELALWECTMLLGDAWGELRGPRGDSLGLLDRLSPDDARAFDVPLELRETVDAYVVRVEVPGIARGCLRVVCDDHALRVTGERREHGEGSVRYTERAYGAFARSLTLPGAICPEAARARYVDGVLVVVLPKARKTITSSVE